jgi:NADH-quinone oxidoreductase subunit J
LTPTEAILLYVLFALGGTGLYLALPRARARSTQMAGLLLGAAAIIGVMMLLGSRVLGPSYANVYFYLFAGIALLCAARVVTHPKPVYSAVYFVGVAVAVAALVLLQGAEFLAVALIIVYAGAILVTYAFVIMLSQQTRIAVYDTRAREPFVAVLIGFVAMAAIAGRVTDGTNDAPAAAPPIAALAETSGGAPASRAVADDAGNTADIGRSLMMEYVVALQLAGILLLVGMVGAIALVRKRVPRDVPTDPPPPLGQVGRQVRPF